MATSIKPDSIFRPNNPPTTRTIGFLLRSLPPATWALLYLLFSAPLLWENWQKLVEGPVPAWRWVASLLFPVMLFGLLCVLQIAGGRRDPVVLRPDGLYLGRKGRLKAFWRPVSCVVEGVRGTPGVYRLSVKASTPLTWLTGGTTVVYSGLTDDLAEAEQFAKAFAGHYANRAD